MTERNREIKFKASLTVNMSCLEGSASAKDALYLLIETG